MTGSGIESVVRILRDALALLRKDNAVLVGNRAAR
jgi:hypothetical protein